MIAIVSVLVVWVLLLSVAVGLLLWTYFKTYVALTGLIAIGDEIRDVIAQLPKELQEQFPADWRSDTGSAAKKGFH